MGQNVGEQWMGNVGVWGWDSHRKILKGALLQCISAVLNISRLVRVARAVVWTVSKGSEQKEILLASQSRFLKCCLQVFLSINIGRHQETLVTYVLVSYETLQTQ